MVPIVVRDKDSRFHLTDKRGWGARVPRVPS